MADVPMKDLRETLTHLRGNTHQGARIDFPALEWMVFIHAEPDGLFAVFVMNPREQLAGELMTAAAVEAYFHAVSRLEDLKAGLMAKVLINEAEALLS